MNIEQLIEQNLGVADVKPTNNNALLREVLQKTINESKEAAMKQVTDILSNAQNNVSAYVTQIRTYRKKIRDHLTAIGTIEKAQKFCKETGNPLPLFKALRDSGKAQKFCQAIGVTFTSFDQPIFNIPVKNAKSK